MRQELNVVNEGGIVGLRAPPSGGASSAPCRAHACAYSRSSTLALVSRSADPLLALSISVLRPSVSWYVASQSSHRKAWSDSPSNTSTRPICNSWNRGKCAYAPVCSYRHVCATCQEGPHQAKDCVHTPPDSINRT